MEVFNVRWKTGGSAACVILLVFLPSLTVRAEEPETERVAVVHASAPVPALRYRFWPSSGESKSISAMPMFTRACFLMDQADTPESDKELNDVYAQLSEGNWSEELAQRSQDVLDSHQAVLDEMYRATPCMDVSF
ncbi:MAG: hypothetical protein AAGJ83_08985, partial [Planctomycetota bacterium]